MMRWLTPGTLRFRLAACYALGGIVLLSSFSAVIYGFVDQRMAQPLDRQLRADLEQVKARLKLGQEGHFLWDGRELSAGKPWNWNDPWFEVWSPGGKLVLRQWPLDEARLGQLPFAPAEGWETLSVFNIAQDLRLRVLSSPWKPAGAEAGTMLRVMRVHKPAADALSALLLILAVSLPVVVALLVLIGYLLTRHWLRPLDDMVAEAETIGASDLSRRLPVRNGKDELGRLAEVFNGTLARLEESFSALDRFAADASHELRTPLTAIRSVGEVALQRARSELEYREVIASMLEETLRMQHLVERLLQLARASGGSLRATLSPERVDRIVTECIGDLAILAEERNQHLNLEVTECELQTDAMLFRQVLQNLVDNAIKFTPPGGTIQVALENTATSCVLSVTDSGPGIPAELKRKVLDRFFRAEDGNSAAGYGLGLSITRAYVRMLGGVLECENLENGGCRFRVLFHLGQNTGA